MKLQIWASFKTFFLNHEIIIYDVIILVLHCYYSYCCCYCCWCCDNFHLSNVFLNHRQGISLKGANLSNLDLRHINFKMANLSCSDLTGANLSHCSLENANLSGAQLDVSDSRKKIYLTAVNVFRFKRIDFCWDSKCWPLIFLKRFQQTILQKSVVMVDLIFHKSWFPCNH